MPHEIDALVRDAVFGDASTKSKARERLHLEARRRGAASSSIYPLYMAIGRGEVKRRFTTPAFNIRALTYDSARALSRFDGDRGVVGKRGPAWHVAEVRIGTPRLAAATRHAPGSRQSPP